MRLAAFLLFFLFAFIYSPSGAQDIRGHCATPAYEQYLQKKFPSYKRSADRSERVLQEKTLFRNGRSAADDKIYTIPVVVHIIYNSAASNITNERVYSQIKVLNEDYRRLNKDRVNTPPEFSAVAGDVKVEFCLASRDPEGNVTNGIIRKNTSVAQFRQDQDDLLKGLSYWPSDQYLNIWVTTLAPNSDGTDVLGYTYSPVSSSIPDLNYDVMAELDGVVIYYKYFGVLGNANLKYALGRTTTHEVGHWLGLRHIWGDTWCGDDYVDDTPVQGTSNINMSMNACTHYSFCNGIKTLDMSGNYMDYSPDKCMNIFTEGQIFRMRTVIQTNQRRLALHNSVGCCNPAAVRLPVFQGFENGNPDGSGWSTGEEDSDFNWKISPRAGFGESSYSLMASNGTGTKNKSCIYTSLPLDFDSAKHPVLEFSLAYAKNGIGPSDSLVFSYNSNCKDFIPFHTLTGDDLVTASSTGGNFQASATDWKTIKIDLQAFAGKKIAQLRFENRSQGENNLYIDDINIYDITEEFQVNLYPNPASGEITAEVGYKNPAPLTIQVFNSLGQVTAEYQDKTKDFKKTIPLNAYASGIYFLRLIMDGHVQYRKFTVY
jgi:hypothetical protein